MTEQEKLKKLIKKKDTRLCLRKIQCVYLKNELSWSSEQIATLVGYCPSYVREVLSAYKKEGESCFRMEELGGRHRENLSKEEEKQILEEFNEEAEAGRVIEISKIHELYSERVTSKGKKPPAKSTTYRMLERHGWRKIMPRPKHSKNKKEEMDKFKK